MSVPKAKTATLIDTITEGYWLINKHPWLLLLPVFVNIYLVLGAQLSFAPLIEQLSEIMRRLAPANPSSEASLEQIAILSQLDMRLPLALLNVLPTLPVRLLGDITTNTGLPQFPVLTISTIWEVVVAFVLINTLALPISALFLTHMAIELRNEQAVSQAWLPQAVRTSLMMLLTSLIIAVLAMLIMFPMVVLSTVLMAFSQTLGVLVMTFLFIALFWAQIYLGFTNEALVLGRLNPIQAISTSFKLVRQHFWSTLGLLIMVYVISGGSAIIWRSLFGTSWGVIIAVLGCAYIGTGLQAARFGFVRDRLAGVVKQGAEVRSRAV